MNICIHRDKWRPGQRTVMTATQNMSATAEVTASAVTVREAGEIKQTASMKAGEVRMLHADINERYEAYVDYCDRLGLGCASFEEWQKVNGSVSDNFILYGPKMLQRGMSET